MYHRKIQYSPSAGVQSMELYRQPVPFETVYHRKHPLSIPYDNFTVNIANK